MASKVLMYSLSLVTVTSEILEGMFFLDYSANMQSTGTLLHTSMQNYLRDLF